MNIEVKINDGLRVDLAKYMDKFYFLKNRDIQNMVNWWKINKNGRL